MSPRMGEELALSLALEGEVYAAQGETAGLVELAKTLAALPEPEIDARFAAMLEARLLEDALENEPGAAPRLTLVYPAPERPAGDGLFRRAPVVQMPLRRFVVRRSLAALAAAAALAAFPVIAAAQSLPGSPFYALKTTFERAELALFGGPVEDAFSHVQFAGRRTDEAKQLIALGASQDLIAATIARADGEIRAAAVLIRTTTDRATLARFADAVRQTESNLLSVSPGGLAPRARDALAAALDASGALRQQVDAQLGLTPIVPVLEQPVASVGPSAEPRAQTSAGPSRPAAPVKKATRDTAHTTADETGHGKEVRDVEGCQPPASDTPLNDTLGFLCRLGLDALIGG